MLKKNLIYQVLYQIIVLVIPLILSKYVTNVINKDVLGIYNYSYSIGSYFLLLGMLGIQKHGTRVISQVKKDEVGLRKTFWSLMYIHIVISLVSILTYFSLVLFVNFDSKNIFIIQGLYVVSVLFDITWLFYGLENFKSVVIKNLCIKIIEVILILTIVKGNSDLWLYTLIMAGSVLLGQLVMLPQAIRLIHPIKVGFDDIKKHIKPILLLSISVISTSIYGILDKTILGALSPDGKGDVAIYEYSDKIIKIPLYIITAIETVMLPKMSSLAASGEIDEMKKNVYLSFVLISMFSIGAAFGIASISDSFVHLWYGSDYLECKNVILWLSPLVFIISFGDIIRSQYLIPNNKDFGFTLSLVMGALLNLTINLILIPFIGLKGAVIGTLSTELLITIIQFFIARKNLNILSYLLIPIPFIVAGFGMFFINYFICQNLGYRYLTLILQIIIGATTYLIVSLLYLYLFKKDVFKLIRRRKDTL